jgi:hypothetical protein
MGANPTQATGLVVFIIAFLLMAAGMYFGGSVMLVIGGLAVLGGACALFLKCKPWEHQE